jgi:hypothetical protein
MGESAASKRAADSPIAGICSQAKKTMSKSEKVKFLCESKVSIKFF